MECKDVTILGDLDLNNLDLATKHMKRTKFQVEASISITKSKIRGSVNFGNAIFQEPVSFIGTNFKGSANFEDDQFNGYAYFDNAQFSRDANFFSAQFNRDITFWGTQFSGEVLTFRKAKFNRLEDQEDACRRAKQVLGNHGNKDEADYHFYHEMVAKRKQKDNPKRGIISQNICDLEWLFVQLIFGYGVHPWRVIFSWLIAVSIFAFIYWIGDGIVRSNDTPVSSWLEYVYFSIVSAATPGYGGYHPNPGIYQALAGFEAIFGTFMWAAFIATFARKYMG